MNRSLPLTAVIAFTASTAFAAVTVNTPVNSSDVNSPFKLSAVSSNCSSQPTASMAYSIDSGTDLNIVGGESLSVSVSAGVGPHTVHVKSWGNQGASCVTDVAVTVHTAATEPAIVPSYATSVSNIQSFGGWTAINDTGATGKSSGATSIVGSPSQSGHARRFATSFSGNGDERYSISFGDDDASMNFLYDGWIYLSGSAANIGNIEMDLNQVLPNGQTVIFGFQCDGWNGTWDYTMNSGTPTHPKDAWIHTSQACNPRTWAVNAWHHIQVSYSRNAAGVVTYKSVWLDDKQQNINATVPSAFALGWAQTLLTNFQIDGVGAGSNTVFIDNLTIYRW